MFQKSLLMMILGVLLFVSVGHSYAGTINVTTTNDEVLTNGLCSLREAITAAMAPGTISDCPGATASPNTISLSAGTYTLTSGTQLPTVTGTTLTIQPSGAGVNVILEAATSVGTATTRLFQIASTGVLTLNNMTVRNGRPSGVTSGGCVASEGSFTTQNIIFADCRVSLGGGAINASGVVNLMNSTVQDARVNSTGFTNGGGLNCFNCTLTVTNSTFSGNQISVVNASKRGGAISCVDCTVNISGSTFNNNIAGGSSGYGGALYFEESTVTITGTTFSSNSAQSASGSAYGGAVYINDAASSLNVDDSVFNNNSSSSGGGIYVSDGAFTMTDSRFMTNTATTGSAVTLLSPTNGSVSNSCFTNNNNTAVSDGTSAGVLTATGNWWGSSWGPHIPALDPSTGSYVSSGDRINGNGATVVGNVLVDVGLTSAGSHTTPPTGAWLTSAPTVAGALCPTESSPTTLTTLAVTVLFQGRPAAPNARLVLPIEVILKPTAGGAAVVDNTFTTNQSGVLTVSGALSPGIYTLWVKGSHTLAQSQTVTIVSGSNAVTLNSALLEGDANNDNLVTLADFSMLATAFGTASGQSGYDARVDFNGDDLITLPDFSLLATNFSLSGTPEP